MSEKIDDIFSQMESAVRVDPSVSIRFLAEELRRYGIKTNSKNDKDKTIFFQSAHIVMTHDREKDNDGIVYPAYTLVSFKDLFKLIGKNDKGADDQDVVRVWYIAEKLEKRRCLQILGTSSELLDESDRPNLPEVYANLHHIHRNDSEKDSYVYKSKFATNKAYRTNSGWMTSVADYFILS